MLEEDPRKSVDFLESIHLGAVRDRDFREFEKTIKATNVDSEAVEWDCQDYVLEILDNLEEECIVDGARTVSIRGRRGS